MAPGEGGGVSSAIHSPEPDQQTKSETNQHHRGLGTPQGTAQVHSVLHQSRRSHQHHISGTTQRMRTCYYWPGWWVSDSVHVYFIPLENTAVWKTYDGNEFKNVYWKWIEKRMLEMNWKYAGNELKNVCRKWIEKRMLEMNWKTYAGNELKNVSENWKTTEL